MGTTGVGQKNRHDKRAVASVRQSASGSWRLVSRLLLLASGLWRLATGTWLLAAGDWPLAFFHELPLTGHFRLPDMYKHVFNSRDTFVRSELLSLTAQRLE